MLGRPFSLKYLQTLDEAVIIKVKQNPLTLSHSLTPLLPTTFKLYQDLPERKDEMPEQPDRLILASQSPRRRMLLTEAGYRFEVIRPDDSAESGTVPDETPAEMVVRLARQKAEDVAQRVDNGLVIGCDTIALCEGHLLGKPTDRDDARRMLRHLSGRLHSVLSGICLIDAATGHTRTDVVETLLIMDRLDDTLLDSYLDSNAWCGKAGAFGYQDGLDWVHIEQGSESNVVGLPMERFAEMLR